MDPEVTPKQLIPEELEESTEETQTIYRQHPDNTQTTYRLNEKIIEQILSYDNNTKWTHKRAPSPVESAILYEKRAYIRFWRTFFIKYNIGE